MNAVMLGFFGLWYLNYIWCHFFNYKNKIIVPVSFNYKRTLKTLTDLPRSFIVSVFGAICSLGCFIFRILYLESIILLANTQFVSSISL